MYISIYAPTWNFITPQDRLKRISVHVSMNHWRMTLRLLEKPFSVCRRTTPFVETYAVSHVLAVSQLMQVPPSEKCNTDDIRTQHIAQFRSKRPGGQPSRRCYTILFKLYKSLQNFCTKKTPFENAFLLQENDGNSDLKLSPRFPTSRRRWRLFMAGHAMLNRGQMKKTYVALQICYCVFSCWIQLGVFVQLVDFVWWELSPVHLLESVFFCILVANSMGCGAPNRKQSSAARQKNTKSMELNQPATLNNGHLTMPCTILPCNKKWWGINVCTDFVSTSHVKGCDIQAHVCIYIYTVQTCIRTMSFFDCHLIRCLSRHVCSSGRLKLAFLCYFLEQMSSSY